VITLQGTSPEIHKPSGKRSRYQKIVPGVGPVETDDIVKGYDLGEGQYVLFEPDCSNRMKLMISNWRRHGRST
jgi:DNA end-binding protein Ku